MVDETQQILEMVASGTITPEQAEDLLDALTKDTAAPVAEISDRVGRTRRGHTKRSVRPSVAALAEAAMYGVDADFIRSMQEAGYRDLTLTELTDLARYGADSEFIRSLEAAGYRGLSVGELEELAMYGVDGGFIEKMRGAGLTDLSVEELTELGRSGADEEAIRALRALGHMEPSADAPAPVLDEEADLEEPR